MATSSVRAITFDFGQTLADLDPSMLRARLLEKGMDLGEEALERGVDIGLLARRVVAAVDWLGRQPRTARLPLGLFGASTGAAAALAAAAHRPADVRAVVSRGGRPDLAGDLLPQVQTPTLLIVDGRDEQVIGLNEQAAAMLRVEHAVQIVPGATHLFEEPGALEQVAGWAAEWFDHQLTGGDLTLDGYLPDGDDSNG